MDVRGGATDEHAVVTHYDSLDSSLADNGNDGFDRAVAGKQSADSDQYARGVQFTARLSGDVRKRGDR
jgi:hypothetical protein